MPKELEKELWEQAHKKGLKGGRAEAYVYGTMRKTGWKPGKPASKKKKTTHKKKAKR